MPLETASRIVMELTGRGFNADREAITLIAGTDDPHTTIDAVVERAPDDALRLTSDHVRSTIESDPTISTGSNRSENSRTEADTPHETKGYQNTNTEPDPEPDPEAATGPPPEPSADSDRDDAAHVTASVDTATGEETAVDDTSKPTAATADPHSTADSTPSEQPTSEQPTPKQPASEQATSEQPTSDADRSDTVHLRELEIANDMTGHSTGTGEYADFVRTFRDRYERLSKILRGRVNHRPASAIAEMPGGSDAAMIGLVNDVRSTRSGHWLVELEDTTGTFPALIMKDKGIADVVDEILLDECIAVDGTLADDSGILFADAVHFPDVPRTFQPNYADRHVQAALISDVHVGSQEFMRDAWTSFADWLHTAEAESVEYLLLAGDMVEGVGVYPDQDEELDIVDIYEQYEQFSEHLKEVPADLEIVMIPGNHDAVRLAEPQPAFDEELRDLMSAHDSRIVSNPAAVTVEGVSVLMYHGVSLDEVIAELPAAKASYDDPHKAMYQLLKKRHVAPQFGGHTRVAPEERDHLVIEEVPEVFHTGHVHKLGWGKYHNVLAVNSGCWQEQTDFQKSVNIDPDCGFAPILDLDTLDMTVRKFA